MRILTGFLRLLNDVSKTVEKDLSTLKIMKKMRILKSNEKLSLNNQDNAC